MSEPFIGQIQPLAIDFAPRGWAMCDGQLLPISQNTALFSLLGTTYGGDGRTTFALPDLRSRVPLHFGHSQQNETYRLGERAGQETVILNLNELPSHNHAFRGTTDPADNFDPDPGAALAEVSNPRDPVGPYYASDAAPIGINPDSLTMVGGSQPHDNVQPYLAINWCIAMQGLYPSRG